MPYSFRTLACTDGRIHTMKCCDSSMYVFVVLPPRYGGMSL